MENIISNFWNSADKITNSAGNWFTQHLISILVILLGAWIVRRFSSKIINEFMRRTVRSDIYPTKSDRERRIQTLETLINAALRTGVYIIAGILIIGEIAPGSAAALFTSAGLFGVALGFGAQSLVKDLVSGIFIIIENQYRIGDVIEITGVSGIVEDITVRTTILRDLDGNLHHVPNGSIVVTTNKTIGFSRLNEDLIVDTDTDIDRLEHIINHIGEQMAASVKYKPLIVEAPHFSRIKAYSVNGVVVKVLGKTTVDGKWEVTGQFYKQLKETFDQHKIKMGQHASVIVASKKK